jgi:hypothetical protein
MGEYNDFQPRSDWGGSARSGLEDLAGYHPGGGAMVAMGDEAGYEDSEYGGPHQYTPYPGYGPAMAQTDYPHGPHDEPDMGWEGFGRARAWGARERGNLRGMWRDQRPWWKRLLNPAMEPASPVVAAPPPPGYPAPPAPVVAPPAADMGFEWHEDQPAPPPPVGQWGGAQQWGQQWGQGQGERPGWGRGRDYRRRW